MLKRCFSGLTVFVCLLSLSFIVSCGDPEGTESPTIVDTEPAEPLEPLEPIVIPEELYDTSDLTYDISDEEVQELMALELPDNWMLEKNPERHAKYFHAQLRPTIWEHSSGSHIVAERHRKRLLAPGGFITTLDESINHAKARLCSLAEQVQL